MRQKYAIKIYCNTRFQKKNTLRFQVSEAENSENQKEKFLRVKKFTINCFD